MKEIGAELKEKRIEIGISTKEVASDLGIDEVIIENLEDANDKVFKDVLQLKDVVLQYTKYLGLEEDKMIDQINDYLFEKTSKIRLEDIKEEINKNMKKQDEKKVRTPYTIERKIKKADYSIFFICLVIAFLLVVFYFILRKLYIG